VKKVKKQEYVTIKCTPNQAMLIENMLEYGSRIGAGQLHHIVDIIDVCQKNMREVKVTKEMLQKLDDAYYDLYGKKNQKLAWFALGSQVEKCIKPILFPELAENESYGVGMKQIPNGQIMYEMYKKLQNYRVRNDKEKNSVLHHEPLKYSKEPLIEVSQCGDEK
jgi:hypothetical protein